MTGKIEVSAEFGGRDAAAKVLPHFRALKEAARGINLADFPFEKLGYILRVDGEVTGYGLAGAGNIDVNKKDGYVSVDIGIPSGDWSSLQPSELAGYIQRAILSSTLLLKHGGPRLQKIDFADLEKNLSRFCAAYAERVSP